MTRFGAEERTGDPAGCQILDSVAAGSDNGVDAIQSSPTVLHQHSSPLVKLLSSFSILILFSLAFCASLNESQEELHGHSSGTDRDRPENASEHKSYSRSEQACLGIECSLLVLGIGAFLYLMLRVVLARGISRAVLVHPYQPDNTTEIGDVTWCLKMPQHFANYPTAFFMHIFIAFSFLGIQCLILRYVEHFTEGHTMTGVMVFAQTVKCILLVTFIAIQLWFFVMHSRVCLLWKLNDAWMAFSVAIAVNLSCWCFHTRSEIRQVFVVKHSDWCSDSGEHATSLKRIVESLAESFSPFLSESFLMGAILSGSVLSNAGRWARAFLIKVLSGASVAESKRCISKEYRVTGKFLEKLRKNGLKLGFLYIFLMSVSIGTLVIKLLIACSKSVEDWNASLNRIQATSYICGCVVCCLLLVVTLKRDDADHDLASSEAGRIRHTADRVMLWCGLAGVVVYRMHRIWRTFVTRERLPYLEGGSSLVNVIQSVLQVTVIDRILAGRIRNLHPRLADTAAWLLIFLNAAEWFIYATAFSLIAGYRNDDPVNLTLAIVTMPLHVFFYFHSIGCFYDFKEYMHRPRQYQQIHA